MRRPRRATWPPADREWMRTHPHGLPPAPPYGGWQWRIPGPKTAGGPKVDPWNAPRFKAHYGGGAGQRALVWLMETFTR